ncbi:hypothetical protein QZH47_03425 [Pseudomonas corrugata]
MLPLDCEAGPSHRHCVSTALLAAPQSAEVYPHGKAISPRYSPDSQPLAGLESLWFPGWTLFVEGYDAGIPARLVEGGLLCIVDPWTQMEVGDVFHLYWKDKKGDAFIFVRVSPM